MFSQVGNVRIIHNRFNGEAGGRSTSIVTRLRIGRARFDSPQIEKLLIATVSTLVLGPYLQPRDHYGSDVNLTTHFRVVPTFENVTGFTFHFPLCLLLLSISTA